MGSKMINRSGMYVQNLNLYSKFLPSVKVVTYNVIQFVSNPAKSINVIFARIIITGSLSNLTENSPYQEFLGLNYTYGVQ